MVPMDSGQFSPETWTSPLDNDVCPNFHPLIYDEYVHVGTPLK